MPSLNDRCSHHPLHNHRCYLWQHTGHHLITFIAVPSLMFHFPTPEATISPTTTATLVSPSSMATTTTAATSRAMLNWHPVWRVISTASVRPPSPTNPTTVKDYDGGVNIPLYETPEGSVQFYRNALGHLNQITYAFGIVGRVRENKGKRQVRNSLLPPNDSKLDLLHVTDATEALGLKDVELVKSVSDKPFDLLRPSARHHSLFKAQARNTADPEKGKYTLIRDAEDFQPGTLDKPLPCFGCGIGWFSFLVGFAFPLMWYYATILYFGNYYRKDPRERAGLAASAVCAMACTVILLIVTMVLLF
ncbi:hypothetical protein RHMOL_Rhmol03G0254800 [Rhododendron molle]|uniref:Uncharacterized protein n=1 Tax=Rhododendron molle TaxID=49168 RepID=A0ACC0PJR3_RHOML|nr:hypothetical protein RHMOL_Rhmol03G0254800 [Rhododendron molle]